MVSIPVQGSSALPIENQMRQKDGTISKGTLPSDAAPYFDVTIQRHGGHDDLSTVSEVTTAKIAEVLAARYQQERIYSSIGPVLVALNPYQTIKAGSVSVYDESVARLYYERSQLETAPHIYKIGAEAYKDLLARNQSQCIVITGESGAGKTETTKACMRLLATITEQRRGDSVSKDVAEGAVGVTGAGGVSMQDVKHRLLESNPVLEAFGNAQTIRNDNSSRFGKYQAIHVDFKGDVVGGRVTKYLLEKSRVVQQGTGERNFHVFYQLIAGASPSQRKQFKLRDRSQGGYAYLMHEHRTIDGVDDKEAFMGLQASMANVGLSVEEQDQVFRLLSGILMLGEVDFEDHGLDQKASIANEEALQTVAQLLEVNKQGLDWALTSSLLASATRTKSIQRRVKDRTGSLFNRDTLAKEIFKRIFDYVVAKVNEGMECPGTHYKTIGMIDIYGFEVFEINGFEQFCINYVNERLQQSFIALTLEAEQREYESEGLDWTHVEYFNNKVVVDALDSRPTGVFEVLDVQCLFKEATPEQLLASLAKNTSSNAYFLTPQDLIKNKIVASSSSASANQFAIRHYAGDVVYTVDAFLDKNRDTLTQDLLTVMELSSNKLLVRLFQDERTPQEKAKRPPTIGMQFRRQVDELMQSLKSCQQHYVRCIKPNDQKKPGLIDMERVMHQVKYLGLRENIVVRQAGFCYRGRFKDFTARYSFLCVESWQAKTADPSNDTTAQAASDDDGKAVAVVEMIRSILSSGTVKTWGTKDAAMPAFRLQEGQDYVIGKTMVFIRTPKDLHAIEERRARLLPLIVTRVQARIRAFLQRTRYLKAVKSAIVLEAQSRRLIHILRFKRMKQAALRLQCRVRVLLAVRHVKAIRKQFKNRPPRTWARQIQRVYRGHVERMALDTATYERAKAIGARLQEMRRRQRASVRLGAWYRSKLYSRRYRVKRGQVIKVQALARVLLARRCRERTIKADLEETRRRLHQGWALMKSKPSGDVAGRMKEFRLSAAGDRLTWVSPCWASNKEGLVFTRIKELHRGCSTSRVASRDESRCCLTVVFGEGRHYVIKASSEHDRDSIYRFLALQQQKGNAQVSS